MDKKYIQIIDICMEIGFPNGSAEDFIHPDFGSFFITEDQYQSGDRDKKLQILVVNQDKRSQALGNLREDSTAEILVQNEYVTIIGKENVYEYYYHDFIGVLGMQISENRKKGILFLNQKMSCIQPEKVAEEIYFSIRDFFFLYTRSRQMLMLHSSSIVYQKKAYLFLAPSGGGKTTQTRLWQQYMGVQVLDGDLNLLYEKDGEIYVQGLPWCGTSGQSCNQSAILGGMFFLEKKAENQWNSLPVFQRIMHVFSRCISPAWTPKMREENLLLIQRYVHQGISGVFGCVPDESAVVFLKHIMETSSVDGNGSQ